MAARKYPDLIDISRVIGQMYCNSKYLHWLITDVIFRMSSYVPLPKLANFHVDKSNVKKNLLSF